jgi:hypothetical protein
MEAIELEKKDVDTSVDLADTMKKNKEAKERLAKERLERNRKVLKDAKRQPKN